MINVSPISSFNAVIHYTLENVPTDTKLILAVSGRRLTIYSPKEARNSTGYAICIYPSINLYYSLYRFSRTLQSLQYKAMFITKQFIKSLLNMTTPCLNYGLKTRGNWLAGTPHHFSIQLGPRLHQSLLQSGCTAVRDPGDITLQNGPDGKIHRV